MRSIQSPQMVMLSCVCLTLMFTLNACVRGGYYPVAVPSAPAPVSPAGLGTATAKWMIFGGTDHTVYLGCLNCPEYAVDSVKNQYGTHGSAYSQDSIMNHYSQYGSPYSAESACNQYANDPPVIVDQAGKFYGRLTLNRYRNDIGMGAQLAGWLAAVCQG